MTTDIVKQIRKATRRRFTATNWNCWAYRSPPGSVLQFESQMINRTPPSSANP